LNRFDSLAILIHKHYDLTIHRHINHSYYLQRIEEMKLLLEQLNEAEVKLEIVHNRLDEHYQNSFQQWHKDIRWLSVYLNQ